MAELTPPTGRTCDPLLKDSLTAEPTGRTTDHASKLDSSHGGEHAARDRIAAALRKRCGQMWPCTCDEAYTSRGLTAHDCVWHREVPEFLDIAADAITAVLPELAELDRLRAEAEEGWRAKDAAEEERDVQRALADAFAETADSQRHRAEKAEGLLEIALHLCRHGDLAPGGGETWADWARTTETHLRGKEAPDAR